MKEAISGRSIWGHMMVLIVWGTTFYALVLFPFVLDELVKGFFIASSGAALQWEFGTAIATATASQQEHATKAGADAGAMIPGAGTTTTVTEGPPMQVTTGPTPAASAPISEGEVIEEPDPEEANRP